MYWRNGFIVNKDKNNISMQVKQKTEQGNKKKYKNDDCSILDTLRNDKQLIDNLIVFVEASFGDRTANAQHTRFLD